MQKTTFKILKMDCPSEEQLIRMKLDEIKNIKMLDFNISNRELFVYHSDNYDQILKSLNSLNFDTSFVETISVEDVVKKDDNRQERTLLYQVLGINFFFFALELLTGFIANSMGLVADSLDMLADSIVYGLALLAVGGTMARKKGIAKASGYLQLILTALGFYEVIRRFVGLEELPSFQTIIVISLLALIGNAVCLFLLKKSKSEDAHMKASMIFTSNDVVVNIGVIIAGILVYISESKYPDLIVGAGIFIIVGKGAIRILKIAK